jgi:transposase-like protein
MERKCPSCKGEVRPINIKDLPDGEVEFNCEKCGAHLEDNAERTALKVKKKAAAAKKKK